MAQTGRCTSDAMAWHTKLLVASVLLTSGQCVSVYNVQDSLLPNTTVLISGDDLQSCTFSFCASACVLVEPLAITNTGAMLTVPQDTATGTTLNLTLASSTYTHSILLGLPQLSWWSSNPHPVGTQSTAGLAQGKGVQLGSTLSLYGKNLAFDPRTNACTAFSAQESPVSPFVALWAVPSGLAPSPGNAVLLPAPSADTGAHTPVRSCYRVDALLPATLSPGDSYDIWLGNGLEGPGLVPTYGSLLLPALLVTQATDPWPNTTYILGTTPGCDTIPNCMHSITAVGGGTLYVPPGTVYMPSSSQVLFPGTVPVALVGAGRDQSSIVWMPGTALVPGTNPITANDTVAAWGIYNLTLALYAAPQPGAQPVLGMDFLYMRSGTSGVVLKHVRIINDLTGYPGIQLGNAISAMNSSFLLFEDVQVYHAGNCASQWPHNTAVYLSDNCTDFTLLGVNISAACPGWSIAASSRFSFSDSLITSIGPVSQGQGINTLSPPSITEHIYYGNNRDVGNPDAPERWESMTYDGSGGFYNGSLSSLPIPNGGGSQTLPLQDTVRCSPYGNSTACLPSGLTVAIMRGTGTGQVRRLLSVSPDSRSVTVTPPFDPSPVPGDSYLSVTGYRGQATFEGNTYVNGTCFQFYGMAVDTVVSGNTFTEMFDTGSFNRTAVAAGIRLFGHRYVGGYEPNWRNLVQDNNATCITQFVAYSDNIDNVTFSQGHVFRGNVISGGVNLAINLVHDPLMEHNTFNAAYCAWAGQELPAGTVLVNGTSPGAVVR